MGIDDTQKQREIQDRTAHLVPRCEVLLKDLLLRSLYDDERREAESILRELEAIKRLAHG